VVFFSTTYTNYEAVIEKGSRTAFTLIDIILILKFFFLVFLVILLKVIEVWKRRLEYIKKMFIVANLFFTNSILFLKLDSLFLGVLKFYFHFLLIAPLIT
jgi:hypothetical protein